MSDLENILLKLKNILPKKDRLKNEMDLLRVSQKYAIGKVESYEGHGERDENWVFYYVANKDGWARVNLPWEQAIDSKFRIDEKEDSIDLVFTHVNPWSPREVEERHSITADKLVKFDATTFKFYLRDSKEMRYSWCGRDLGDGEESYDAVPKTEESELVVKMYNKGKLNCTKSVFSRDETMESQIGELIGMLQSKGISYVPGKDAVIFEPDVDPRKVMSSWSGHVPYSGTGVESRSRKYESFKLREEYRDLIKEKMKILARSESDPEVAQ